VDLRLIYALCRLNDDRQRIASRASRFYQAPPYDRYRNSFRGRVRREADLDCGAVTIRQRGGDFFCQIRSLLKRARTPDGAIRCMIELPT